MLPTQIAVQKIRAVIIQSRLPAILKVVVLQIRILQQRRILIAAVLYLIVLLLPMSTAAQMLRVPVLIPNHRAKLLIAADRHQTWDQPLEIKLTPYWEIVTNESLTIHHFFYPFINVNRYSFYYFDNIPIYHVGSNHRMFATAVSMQYAWVLLVSLHFNEVVLTFYKVRISFSILIY
jgi:hypothetical protein